MKNYIDEKQAWEKIIKELSNEKDIHTVPTNNLKPKWFTAKSIGNDRIFTYSSNQKEPSCNINGYRVLTKQEFEDIYPLAIKRKSGENVSAKANALTRNSSYYFGIIYEIVFKGDE